MENNKINEAELKGEDNDSGDNKDEDDEMSEKIVEG